MKDLPEVTEYPPMPKVKDPPGVDDCDIPKPEDFEKGRTIDIQAVKDSFRPLPRKEEYGPFRARLDKAYRASGLGVEDFFASEDMFKAMKGQTMDLYDSGYASRKEVISIQPGDVIVLMYKQPLTDKACNMIKDAMKPAFPDTKCIVLDGGTTLEVYREQVKDED